MFQVEPVLWLQAAASPLLTALMTAVTLLGYARAYVVLVLFVAFAVRLRPALYVLLALLIAGLATEGLKLSVAFPRPVDVDARVADLARSGASALVAAGAAQHFLGAPAADALAAIRAAPNADFGFPSGHVAGATALAAGLLLFFRRPTPASGGAPRPAAGLVAGAVAWPLVMAASRMYLGRHFLGDVAGGFVVGGLAVVAAYGLARWVDRAPTSRAAARRPALAAAVATAVLAAALAAGATWLNPENAGRVAGLLAALAALAALRHQAESASLPRRLARFGVALALFLALQRGAAAILSASGAADDALAAFAAGGTVLALALVGSVVAGRRLGLYDAAAARKSRGVPP